MLNLELPNVNSQERIYNNSEKIYLKDTSKALIEIWQGGNTNPHLAVLLDQDSKKYLHVYLK